MASARAPIDRHLARVLLLTLAAWSGALWCAGFALDDLEAIRGNPVVEGSLPLHAAWTRDYWEHQPAGAAGHYRPLASTSLRLDHALYGVAPGGYHLTNLLLHLAVVAAAGALLRRLWSEEARWPWIGLLLFAVHPALADSVAWISGRTSMLSALPGLLAALAVWQRAAGTSALCTLSVLGACALGVCGSMLGKEDGAVFALVLVLVAARRRPAAALPAAAGAALGLLVALGLRWAALGHWLPSSPHAPLTGVGLLERLEVSGAALARGLALLAWPLDPPPTLELEVLRGVPTFAALGAWLWLLATLVGGLWLVRGRGAGTRALGASMCLCALALLPVLQLLPAGELFAPRFAYLPLLLGVPALDRLLRAALPRGARATRALLVMALCAVVLAWWNSATYRDRGSYWTAVSRHNPSSARVLNALGNAEKEGGARSAARAAWERATQLDPGYSRPFTNLGTLALEQGRLDEALKLLGRAVQVGPGNPVAWANLGNARSRAGKTSAAVEAYRESVRLAPRAAALRRGLARALDAAGRTQEALSEARAARALDPGDASAARLVRTLEGR